MISNLLIINKLCLLNDSLFNLLLTTFRAYSYTLHNQLFDLLMKPKICSFANGKMDNFVFRKKQKVVQNGKF